MKSIHQQRMDFLAFLRKVAAADVQACREMIDAGLSVNGPRLLVISDPALHLCAISDSDASDEIMGILIAEGASIEEKDGSGLTALQKAAQHGNERACRRLIDAKANLMAHKPENSPPLSLAVDSGNTRICQWLLEAGAKVDHTDKENWTALIGAVENNDVPMVRLLIEHGADVHGPFSPDGAPLHNAMEAAILNKSLDCARALVEAGFDLHREVVCGTLLHTAAQNGELNFVRWLIDQKLPVDSEDKNKNTPLHLAAGYADKATCKALIEAGADPHLLNKNGMNALHVAARQGQSDTCLYLLQLGLSHDLKTKGVSDPAGLFKWADKTALELAINASKTDCANQIRSYVQSMTALQIMGAIAHKGVPGP
jgi:ankyrin repeat protein